MKYSRFFRHIIQKKSIKFWPYSWSLNENKNFVTECSALYYNRRWFVMVDMIWGMIIWWDVPPFLMIDLLNQSFHIIISCNGSTEWLGGVLSPIIHKSFNFPREKMVKIHQNNLFFPLRFHNYLLFSEKAAHFIYLLEFFES